MLVIPYCWHGHVNECSLWINCGMDWAGLALLCYCILHGGCCCCCSLCVLCPTPIAFSFACLPHTQTSSGKPYLRKKAIVVLYKVFLKVRGGGWHGYSCVCVYVSVCLFLCMYITATCIYRYRIAPKKFVGLKFLHKLLILNY